MLLIFWKGAFRIITHERTRIFFLTFFKVSTHAIPSINQKWHATNFFILEFCCTRRRQLRPRTYVTCQNFHIYSSQIWFIDNRCFKLDRLSDFGNEIWHLKKSFSISTRAYATWNFKIDTWLVPAYSAPDNEGPLAIRKYFKVHISTSLRSRICWYLLFLNFC